MTRRSLLCLFSCRSRRACILDTWRLPAREARKRGGKILFRGHDGGLHWVTVVGVTMRSRRTGQLGLFALLCLGACSRSPTADVRAPSAVVPPAVEAYAAESEMPAPLPLSDDVVGSVGSALDAGLVAGREAARRLWEERLDGTVPLGPSLRAVLASIEHEPPPEEITRNTHYWISNEQAHEVWKPVVEGIGGALIGVGTDQNYVLAGWIRPSVLVLFDFDMSIVDLHRAYHAAFDTAETVEEFTALWATEDGRLEQSIARLYPEGALRDDALSALASARRLVNRRLARVARRHRSRGIDSVFTDAEQYAYVRALWQNGRVFTVRGNLLGDSGLVSVASALDALQLPVGAIYLSNAEQYFDYGPSYRRNLSVLPFAEDGCILRTTHATYLGQPDDEPNYHFNVQGGANMRQWMVSNEVRDMWALYRNRHPTGVAGLSELRHVPQPSGAVEVSPIPDGIARSEELSARIDVGSLPDAPLPRCGIGFAP